MPSASFAVQVGSSEGVISVRYILASQRFFHHGACTERHRSNGHCRAAPHRSRRRSCPSYTSLSATSDQTQCHCSAPLLLNGDIKPDSLPLRAISRSHNEWNWRGSVSSGTRNRPLFHWIVERDPGGFLRLEEAAVLAKATPKTKSPSCKGVVEGLPGLYLAGQWMTNPGGLPIAATSGKFAIQRIQRSK